MLSYPDFKNKNIVLCFSSEGHQTRIKNDNVIIETKNTENEETEVVLQISCLKVFSLWIIGHTNLTSGILSASKKYNFSIAMFSYGFKPYGIWNAGAEGNFLLRQKQYQYNQLDIPKHLVKNKILNQINLIKSIRESGEYKTDALFLLENELNKVDKCENLQSILGVEGSASKVFFNCWYRGIKWNGRKPRTKCDIINTTLDIGYTLLFSYIETLLNLYGFDIYQGVYHRNFYQRKSLVCDIIEPFRCIIDKAVRKAYNLKQLKEDDFILKQDKYYLKTEKNKDYSRWLMQSILENKDNIFLYIQQYYRCFMRNKDIKEYPIFNINQQNETED